MNKVDLNWAGYIAVGLFFTFQFYFLLKKKLFNKIFYESIKQKKKDFPGSDNFSK